MDISYITGDRWGNTGGTLGLLQTLHFINLTRPFVTRCVRGGVGGGGSRLGRSDPLYDLLWDTTRTQISPAAEREHDSGLCRSFMRGKRGSKVCWCSLFLSGPCENAILAQPHASRANPPRRSVNRDVDTAPGATSMQQGMQTGNWNCVFGPGADWDKNIRPRQFRPVPAQFQTGDIMAPAARGTLTGFHNPESETMIVYCRLID